MRIRINTDPISDRLPVSPIPEFLLERISSIEEQLNAALDAVAGEEQAGE